MINLKQLSRLTLMGLLLSACGNNNDSLSSSGSTIGAQSIPNNAITIDNSAVIPVFGNSSTHSLIYVHNHSDITISNIKFSYSGNASSASVASFQALDSTCSSIPAHQACALYFDTPTLQAPASQGSMLIQAKYAAQGQERSFSNIINYARVYNSPDEGALFSGGVSVSSFGHDTGYATVYIYGSGSKQIYDVDSLDTNNSAVTVVAGFNGSAKLASTNVLAVEISTPSVVQGLSASVTAKSKNTERSYTNNLNVGINPSSDGAILTTGMLPLINADATTPGSTSYITNAGNESATITGISSTGGVTPNTAGANCKSGLVLAPAASCSLPFTVPQVGTNGSFTVNYSGGSISSLVQNVSWFNSSNNALLQMSLNPNPVTLVNGESANITVRLTNIGGYNLHLTSTTGTAYSGSGVTTIPAGTNQCLNQNLEIGATCTYIVNLTDGATDSNAQYNLRVAATYLDQNAVPQNYTRVSALTYSAYRQTALLVTSLTSPAQSNNFSAIERGITPFPTIGMTINNIGSGPVNGVVSLGGLPSGIFLSTLATCTNLAAASSCDATLTESTTNIISGNLGTYYLIYNNATTGAITTFPSIQYSVVNPNSPAIVMTESVTNCVVGNGTSVANRCLNNPTNMGGSAVNMKAVLTFTNNSTTTAATAVSLPSTSESAFTRLGYTKGSNTCTSGAAANGGTCTMQYNMPNSVSTTASSPNVIESNFIFNYTYGSQNQLTDPESTVLNLYISVLSPTIAITAINGIIQGNSQVVGLTWTNLYQTSVPTTSVIVAASGGGTTPITGLTPNPAVDASCVALPAGTYSTTCSTTIGTSSSTPVNSYRLTASAYTGVVSQYTTFNVVAPPVVTLSLGSGNPSLNRTPAATIKATLTGGGSLSNVGISMVSQNPSIAILPTGTCTITNPSVQNYCFVDVIGVAIGRATITATAPGFIITPVTPEILDVSTISLPQTGQTPYLPISLSTPYDGFYATGVPWAYNINGIQVPSTRFVVSDNCITDNLTGLMWPKNGAIGFESVAGGGPTAQPDYNNSDLGKNDMNYSQALTAITNMNTAPVKLCGYTDWRMPNINEVNSLSSYANVYGTAPANYLNNVGFINISSVFQTTTPSIVYATGNMAWVTTTGINQSYDRTDTIRVLPVRNIASPSIAPAQVFRTGESISLSGVAWPSPRFTIRSGVESQCITDNLTGLMWPKNGIIGFKNSGTDAFLTQPNYNNDATDVRADYILWNQAATAVTNMNTAPISLCGYTDWRIPNINEAKSLFVNYGYRSPAVWLNSQGFVNIQEVDPSGNGAVYISSTTYSPNTNAAWGVRTDLLAFALLSTPSKSATFQFLLPVRGGY